MLGHAITVRRVVCVRAVCYTVVCVASGLVLSDSLSPVSFSIPFFFCRFFLCYMTSPVGFIVVFLHKFVCLIVFLQFDQYVEFFFLFSVFLNSPDSVYYLKMDVSFVFFVFLD